MRSVAHLAIAGAFVLAVTACDRERALDESPARSTTHTTGAEVQTGAQVLDATVPSWDDDVPLTDEPASAAAKAHAEAQAKTKTVTKVRTSTTTTTGATLSGGDAGARSEADDEAEARERESLEADDAGSRVRSSSESSGGSSGLGIYGQKVPGQELWRVGPTPDGGAR